MAELRELFEIVTRQIEPDPDALREQERRQRRSARNRKLTALAVAAVIIAAIALFAAGILNRGKDGSAPATVTPSASGFAFTVVGLDGSVQSSLSMPDGTVTPDLSPDGTRVAFAIDNGAGLSQIATMRLDGTGTHIITNDPIAASRPRWSPDGTQLLFDRTVRNGVYRVMMMNADGTNVREIQGTRRPELGSPDWSPDGSIILYTSVARGQEDLATVTVTGGRSHRLTTTSFDHQEFGGAWSPNGGSIAFSRQNGSNAEIWLMNADGSGQHRLAALPGKNASAPEWSPDGNTIAFIGSVNGVDEASERRSGALYLVNVATGEVTQILRGVAVVNGGYGRATWLPDGHSLLVMTETP